MCVVGVARRGKIVSVKQFMGSKGDTFRITLGSRVCMSGANLLTCAGGIVSAATGFVYGDHPHEFKGSVATSVLATCCYGNYDSRRVFSSLRVNRTPNFAGCLGLCSIVRLSVR